MKTFPIAAFAIVAITVSMQRPQAQETPPGASQAAAAKCDVACVRANADRAVQACAPRIEAEAPGDYDWLLRPYGSIFQEADTPERPDSAVVRYRGDSIRFLSPQKEWTRAIYECGFDAARQQVAYVRVRLGVMNKRSAVPPGPSAPAPQAARPAAPPLPPQTDAAGNPVAPATATVNLRLIREPSEIDVRQIPSGAKPPRP